MEHVKKYNHIGVVTENFEEIIRFYVEVFGFKLANKFRAADEDSRTTLGLPGMKQDIAMLENEDGSVAMELLYYITPTAPNPARPKDFKLNDIGVKFFSVIVNDINSIYSKVCRYGGTCISEPITHPDGYSYFMLRDPDGNFCEVKEFN